MHIYALGFATSRLREIIDLSREDAKGKVHLGPLKSIFCFSIYRLDLQLGLFIPPAIKAPVFLPPPVIKSGVLPFATLRLCEIIDLSRKDAKAAKYVPARYRIISGL